MDPGPTSVSWRTSLFVLELESYLGTSMFTAPCVCLNVNYKVHCPRAPKMNPLTFYSSGITESCCQNAVIHSAKPGGARQICVAT
jgi:hypothetical protein